MPVTQREIQVMELTFFLVHEQQPGKYTAQDQQKRFEPLAMSNCNDTFAYLCPECFKNTVPLTNHCLVSLMSPVFYRCKKTSSGITAVKESNGA